MSISWWGRGKKYNCKGASTRQPWLLSPDASIQPTGFIFSELRFGAKQTPIGIIFRQHMSKEVGGFRRRMVLENVRFYRHQGMNESLQLIREVIYADSEGGIGH